MHESLNSIIFQQRAGKTVVHRWDCFLFQSPAGIVYSVTCNVEFHLCFPKVYLQILSDIEKKVDQTFGDDNWRKEIEETGTPERLCRPDIQNMYNVNTNIVCTI